MDFNWMSASQTAALIAGIAFTIIAMATTFLAFKYAKKLNSFIKVMAMALVAPFLAIASWLFLVLSFLDGFRNDEFLTVVISILIALFISAMVIIVAKALYAKNREEIERLEAEEEAIEATFIDQSNAIAPAEENVMIENAEEEKETEETEVAKEEEIDEAAVEEEKEETEEISEEAQETEEAQEIEEPAQEEVDEKEAQEEVAQEETEEIKTPAEEEIAEEIKEETETPAEETEEAEEDGEFDDVDDDDFEKFLESLKANADDKKDEE